MKRLILILSAICIGCQSTSDYFQAGQNLEITFAEIEEISSKSANAIQETKSTQRDEEKIRTVDFFVFNAAGKLENRTRFSTDIYSPKTVSLISSGDKTIFAIANADTNINLENLPKNDDLTTSDIESLEIMHKNSYTSLPYVLKANQKIDLLTTPKLELKFEKVHAKIEVINRTPEQLTISELEINNLPDRAYLFKNELPVAVKYNQQSLDTVCYSFATAQPVKISLTANGQKVENQISNLVKSETHKINISKTDNSEITIINGDDWQGYQQTDTHQLGDISVVSSGASFNRDGTLLTFSNSSDYTLTLTAPNYTLSDLTIQSNRPWAVVTGSNGTYNINVQQTQQETERSAVLSIVKDNISIKYLVLTQAQKPIIYYIQEPIPDNIEEKLADQLEVTGGAKSGILRVEVSAHETLAPFVMDQSNSISHSNEDLTHNRVKINFASINATQTPAITNTLRIRRANNSEIATLNISQNPHQLSAPDFDAFWATNPPSQTKTITATGIASQDWTATTTANWLTLTKQDDNLTIQPTSNVGAERTATVIISYDGTILEKRVTQFSGYSFTFTSSDATIDTNNGLLAYSIGKTYNVTITSSDVIDFSTVSATLHGGPGWAITQPTGNGTTGTFSITIPANTVPSNISAQIVFMAGSQEVAMFGVTQAMQISFSQPSPYRIIGGEPVAPNIFIIAAPWDITTITTAPNPAAPLNVTTDAANHQFTINAAQTLLFSTPTTSNNLTILNDRGDLTATYSVSQEPVRFTIDNAIFNNLPATASNQGTPVSTTNNIEWNVNAIDYNPTSSTGWLTATKAGNNILQFGIATSPIATPRTATVTLISKGTTSQPITLSQIVGVGVNDVLIGDQIWLKYNVGNTPGALALSLPSSNWEDSKGGYYVWDDALTACPNGYRLPLLAEYNTLIANTTQSWSKNGTMVYLTFTDNAVQTNSLEFSAAGCISNGSANWTGGRGLFWTCSEEVYHNDQASFLDFYEGAVWMNGAYKFLELSVRCIKN